MDADLGYRLLLRLLHVVSPSLAQEQYSHYQALGRRFGYGDDHVTEALEQLHVTPGERG